MKLTLFSTKIAYLVLTIFFTIMLVKCNQAENNSVHFDLEKAKSEIRSRLNTYEDAMTTGDIEVLGNMYTEDAEIFHDGRSSTIGRQSIEKVFEGWVRDSVIGSFTTTGLWGNEDLLVEQGKGYFAHASGKWKANGKYLLVWEKVDGEWMIFKDTWFDDPKEEE
jgi:ketosteroid isomerase-like protein